VKSITGNYFLPIALLAIDLCICPSTMQAVEVTFDNLALSPETYWNGSDSSGGFTSGGVFFNNSYSPPNPPYDEYWNGWAYSNKTDVVTPGYGNQYSAIAGKGANGSSNYAIAYGAAWGPATASLQGDYTVSGAYFTNITYAYFAVRDGNDGNATPYVRRFGYMDNNEDGDYTDPGDNNGDYPDWFKLTIEGTRDGVSKGTVDFYLADYRFGNSNEDYVLDDWTWCNLSSLGTVDALSFKLSSSDVGSWGMNTPTYVAVDGLTLVPEPSAIALLFAAASAIVVWAWRRRG
jgi:hypothetical protein